jgi:LPPG:FO 2-phospho-L-lactate transferase
VNSKVLALSGGIGGAKLALGLYHVLELGHLTVLANTGDDFEHFGLSVSPDIDTLMYTLAGVSNKDQGWGRADETWSFMEATNELGGEEWFNLGDRDLATNVLRTSRLKMGKSLGEITNEFCEKLGVHADIVPMSKEPVRTVVKTLEGDVPFQQYFVRDQCSSIVTGFEFDGVDAAQPSHKVVDAIVDSEFDAIIICPSNPFISIDPILSVPGYKEALMISETPVVGISPIIGSDSVKGPTAKIMKELGMPVSSLSVAKHYKEILDGFIVDSQDDLTADEVAIPVYKTNIMMDTFEKKKTLARETMEFSAQLA